VRALQPAVADRQLSPEYGVVVTELGGDTARRQVITPLPVEAIGALPRSEHRRGIIQPPGRRPQPLQRFRDFFLDQRCLEAAARLLPSPAIQGLPGTDQ
jgi:hypothetical protein